MRVLLVSDAPWTSSGYGVQVGMIARMIQDLGHDVAILASFGLMGSPQSWNGIPVFPGGMDGFANDRIGPVSRDWAADVTITLKDLWVYSPQNWGPGVRWAPMVPVDHDPIPPAHANLLRAAPAFATIAYAPFGVRKLKEAGFAPLYAPHSYDPNVYFPIDRAKARTDLVVEDHTGRRLHVNPDVFLVGVVAVNRGGVPSRKAWPQLLEGFALYAQSHPDAVLYCHTWKCTDGAEQGVNLVALADQLGVLDRVVFAPQEPYRSGALADQYMRTVYNALDVLQATSIGEGFGVPTLEAQACGVPVVAGDWAAQEDLVFAGVQLPKGDALSFYDGQASHAFIPHPKAVAGSLAAITERVRADRDTLKRNALAGANVFQIAQVRPLWDAVLKSLQNQIDQYPYRGVVRVVPASAVFPKVSA